MDEHITWTVHGAPLVQGREMKKIYSDARPELIEREGGGYLAVGKPTAGLRIGVLGENARDAQVRFAEASNAWAKLLESAGLDRTQDEEYVS